MSPLRRSLRVLLDSLSVLDRALVEVEETAMGGDALVPEAAADTRASGRAFARSIRTLAVELAKQENE